MADERVFANVFHTDDPVPTLCFRTGMTIYIESLMGGQYVGRCWNAQGQPPHHGQFLEPEGHAPRQAFWLEIDGQLLHSHWEWIETDETRDGDKLHHTLTLEHSVRPVTVRVHTLLDGTPVIARWLEIRNTGDRPAALSAAFPWSGVLFSGARVDNPALKEGEMYSVGYMRHADFAQEGAFDWHPLPNTSYRIDGRYRRGRARHPMFVVRNEWTGEHYIGQLAWSGGYAFEFDLCNGPGDLPVQPRLFFRAGVDAPPPLRMIAPGETVTTPEMHLGMVVGDLDAAVQAMHDHVRASVMLPQPRGRGCWVEAMAAGDLFELTPELVHHCIDIGADVGAEVFFIDAGWYANKNTSWATTVGDWNVGDRLPGGMDPIRQHAHDRGMLFGLWMEAERIGHESKIGQTAPDDWCHTTYAGEQMNRAPVDLTNPEVARWFEDSICRVVEENELDFFRLDYNCDIKSGSGRLRDGYLENTYWRYYEALYGVFDRVRERFPALILENCASGGGRTDLGMVKRFSHTWVTDEQTAPRSFSIGNGMTIALPPELVDRHLVGQGQVANLLAGHIDFQSRLCIFGRPSVGAVLWPLGAEPNPVLLDKVRHMVDLYKDFVRPFMPTSRIYHHTPTQTGHNPKGVGVMELASRDRSKAIAGLFHLGGPALEHRLRFRGLDPARRYRVTSDNAGSTFEAHGKDLVHDGLSVRLGAPLTSELLICEAAG